MSPVWYTLISSGQTAVLSSHGVVTFPSHGMLRLPAQWRTPTYRLPPENLMLLPSCLPFERGQILNVNRQLHIPAVSI